MYHVYEIDFTQTPMYLHSQRLNYHVINNMIVGSKLKNTSRNSYV
jgi:hypothetical protein